MAILDRTLTNLRDNVLMLLPREEAMNKVDDTIPATIQTLKKASPTSLKISLRSV